jgi:predicted house-cleaning noncanonical NTP pyrophosphatase (MazG superfamily)
VCEWSVNEALERLRQENRSGIYQILIKDMNKCAGICPRLYDEIIFRETSRLIYIGQANGNGLLLNRLRQELLGVGRGTFFRSIGAILGESPRLARNQTEIKNFVFEGAAYESIKAFILDNCVVKFQFVENDIDDVEKRLIIQHKPPLNIAFNPDPWEYLITQRERCRRIAAGQESLAMHYNKLVRDRIPEIIEAFGKTCVTEILSDEAYLEMLDKKLDEELAEYHKDQNIEELADLLEVIRACAVARGYSADDLEQVRADKASKRGGFEKKILLKEVTED